MRLEFQTLAIENFRCFNAKQTFNLSPSPGLWFLRGRNAVEPTLGSNGSGKSSLMEALLWIITGRTSKGLRNTDIKPWVGKGTPKGELSFLIDDDPVLLTRTATTNGLSINGKEVGPEEGLDLLNASLELLLNTTFFAQGQPLFFDRTPKEKMQLFSEVLKYERWEDRSILASEKVRELERLEAQIEGELSVSQELIGKFEDTLEKMKARAQEWVDERERKEASLSQDIKTLEKQLENTEVQLGSIELEHDAAWLKLREMRGDVKSLEKAMEGAQAARQADEAELSSFQRDLQRLTKELKELGETDSCPICKQPVSGTSFGAHKEELRREIAELSRKIKRGIPKMIIVEHENAAVALSNFRGELSSIERETDNLQSRLNLVKPNAERLRTELNGLKNSKQEREREENPYTEQLQALRKQKRTQEASVEALEEDIGKARRQIERTRFWIKGFKDVALFLIEEVLQEFEAVTNSLLTEVGLVGWQVKYDVEKETKSGTIQRGINVMILSPDGAKGAVKWEAWSGGEGQRLRLVGALALSDVLLRHAGLSTNLEILDEPTQHLSPAGVSDLCNYLADRAKTTGKTCWLIDHTARESQGMIGVVVVTKTEKGSILS